MYVQNIHIEASGGYNYDEGAKVDAGEFRL